MPQQIDVHFLPDLIPARGLAGQAVAVIDVIRASTTIVFALAAGARAIVPCLDIAAARHAARARDGDALLGGERDAVRIEGFDLGNSPREYTREVVAGKTIVFTTTNGTRALNFCRGAGEVLIAAFANQTAIRKRLTGAPVVHLVCSGADGAIAREDVLLAGALTDQLAEHGRTAMNDQALIARHAWRQVAESLPRANLAEALRSTAGARNLVASGQQADIGLVAEVDRHDITPVWRQGLGEIS